MFYVLFTEQTAWWDHVDGSAWTVDDDERVGDVTDGGLLFNDDVYAVVFDNETDARTYADRHDGVDERVNGNDRFVYVSRYHPNRLVVCNTVDDVFDACSGCNDEPTWETTGPFHAYTGFDVYDVYNGDGHPRGGCFQTLDDARAVERHVCGEPPVPVALQRPAR